MMPGSKRDREARLDDATPLESRTTTQFSGKL